MSILDSTTSWLSQNVMTIVYLLILVPSITVHEVMHGYAAYRLGDPTAKNAGRLTLNPLKHLDPFGSVLLPLLLAFSGGPIFGYAKPVPFNPNNFKDVRRGDLITGIAGPASNIVLALFGAGLARIALPVISLNETAGLIMYVVGVGFTMVNLILAFFNLLPIPPLDGSSIVPILLPDSALGGWYRLQRYSFPILIALMFIVPSIFHVDPLGAYLEFTAINLMEFLLP